MAATTYNVTTAEELYAAMAQAEGGDTILMAGGDYGALRLNRQTDFDYRYDSEVVIKSADENNPASFSWMDVREAANITFDAVNFDYTYGQEDVLWLKPFYLSDSTGITFKNAHFEGDNVSGTNTYADGYGTGFGLAVYNSTDVAVVDSEFTSWWKATTFGGVDGLDIIGNEIHDIRSDGLNFTQSHNILVEGNHIHDFRFHPESPDHADLIQLIETEHSTNVTSNLTIRGNILDIGEGSVTQGIFMANGKHNREPTEENMYKNIVIEDNFLNGAQTHGISTGPTDGLIVRNNTLVYADDKDTGTPPAIRADTFSTDVLIEDNVSHGVFYAAGEGSWVVQDNFILQQDAPNQEGYLADQFVSSSKYGAIEDLVVDPNSDLAQTDAGVTWLTHEDTSAELEPLFNVRFSGTDANAFVFDARLTTGPNGPVAPEDATFTWDFGDGTVATGMSVQHAFADAGKHDVTLTVTTPDGQSATTDTTVKVLGGKELTFDAATGSFIHHAYGETVELPIGEESLVTLANGEKALDFDWSGSYAEFSPALFERFRGADGFDLSMRIQGDQVDGNWGEIVRIPSVLTVSVANPTGQLLVDVFNDSGEKFTLQSGVSVARGLEHDIQISLNPTTDALSLTLDGQVVAEVTFEGTVSEGVNHKMFFGNPWNGRNFEHNLMEFELEALASDYSTYNEDVDGYSEATPPSSPDTPPEPTPEDPVSDEGTGDGGTGDGTEEDADAGPVVPELDGMEFDFASVQDPASGVRFGGDAHVHTNADGEAALSLDGTKDYVNLGRVEEYEASQQISIEMEFERFDPEGYDMLLWNHNRMSIAMNDDTMLIRVGQSDAAFYNGFRISDLDIDNFDTNTVRIIADGDEDRLQVMLNDEIVFDDSSRDLDLVQEGQHQRGYMVGSPWSSSFNGEVTRFEIDDSADFIPVDDMLMI